MKHLFQFALAMALMATPSALFAQSAPNGALLYRQRCASCHVASPNATIRLAPDLVGVVGRKAGKAPGFNYSAAIKASGITWTNANLDRFLQAPMRMIPGTRMVMSVPDAAQRAAILTYLSQSRR